MESAAENTTAPTDPLHEANLVADRLLIWRLVAIEGDVEELKDALQKLKDERKNARRRHGGGSGSGKSA